MPAAHGNKSVSYYYSSGVFLVWNFYLKTNKRIPLRYLTGSASLGSLSFFFLGNIRAGDTTLFQFLTNLKSWIVNKIIIYNSAKVSKCSHSDPAAESHKTKIKHVSTFIRSTIFYFFWWILCWIFVLSNSHLIISFWNIFYFY